MNFRRVKVGSILGAALIAMIGLLPSLALAHDEAKRHASPSFFASAVAYEVAEHLRFKGGTGDPTNFTVRLAKATLVGEILTSADAGGTFVEGDFLDADGRSFVKAATGKGPFFATFNTLHDFDPTTKSLSTMLVTATGRLKGELDLSPLSQKPPVPIAPLNNGRWRIDDHLHGPLVAVFLIPFNPVDAVLSQLPPAAAALRPLFEGQLAAQLAANALPNAQTQFVYPMLPTDKTLLGTCFGGKNGSPFSLVFTAPSGASIPIGNVCPVSEDEIFLGFPLTKAEVIFLRD